MHTWQLTWGFPPNETATSVDQYGTCRRGCDANGVGHVPALFPGMGPCTTALQAS